MLTRLPLKDGTEYEPDETYITELDALYYGVATELERMRLWCLADPARRKTKRGIKRFIFLWCDKTCARRPKIVERGISNHASKPPVLESKEVRLANLAQLKKALG